MSCGCAVPGFPTLVRHGTTTWFDDQASCWLPNRLAALQMGGTDENGWYSKNGALLQRSKEICLKQTGKSDRDESSSLVFARRKMRKLLLGLLCNFNFFQNLPDVGHPFKSSPGGRRAGRPAAFQPGETEVMSPLDDDFWCLEGRI